MSSSANNLLEKITEILRRLILAFSFDETFQQLVTKVKAQPADFRKIAIAGPLRDRRNDSYIRDDRENKNLKTGNTKKLLLKFR